jgi:hypothetical protein
MMYFYEDDFIVIKMCEPDSSPRIDCLQFISSPGEILGGRQSLFGGAPPSEVQNDKKRTPGVIFELQ